MKRPEDIGLMKCGALRTGLVPTGPVVFYTKPIFVTMLHTNKQRKKC